MSNTETRTGRRAALIAAAIQDDTSRGPEEGTADYHPRVPGTVRDVVYWTTLGVAATSMLVSGVAGIWFSSIAEQVVATAGVATGVMGIIGGGVGVVYRPGARG
ncbi:hypothetical protein M0722_01600 [Microbacterium sp. KSW4-16]|uniref:hypothetical protein n=1 Tax=Microbacterium aurugineum TaxID=2851642 RepID=UPI0020C01A9F|nr:hypothetical protein [Microbacterium aurugineum]MCK8465877.1 hypothetical protein [Microbacterium aurugineum]